MFKKILLSLLVLTALLVIGFKIATYQTPAPASQAFINGNVLTVNDANDIAEAVYIKGDKIVAVGSNADVEKLIQSDTVVTDLAGKTLIPGFIDAHGHFPGSALAALNVDLNSPPIGNIKNFDELLAALKAKAAVTPAGEWILGIGYDDTMLAEKRHITRQELDAALPDHPVFVWHISGHMGVANSAAFAAAGVDNNTPDPDGGIYIKDENGELTGLMEENATMDVQILAMDFGAGDFLKMLNIATKEYAAAGVTTAQSGAVDVNFSRGLQLGAMLNMIPMRLELWPIFDQMGPALLDGSVDTDDLASEMVNFGAIKVIADGSIQGYTGYLSHPYHQPFHGDEEYRGYPRVAKEALNDWVDKFHSRGYQLAIHANGDASIDDVLDAIELALKKTPREDHRHIIIHSQMARDDQLDRMKALGATPSFFVAHTYYWGDRHRDIFMGPERAARMSPTASALSRELPFTIHLDTPVVPMNPLFLMWTAVERQSSSGAIIGAAERISPMQALRATTIDAAWQIHQERERGSIEPGKLADLVVLSGNPLTAESIKALSVEQTVVGGRTIFPAK